MLIADTIAKYLHYPWPNPGKIQFPEVDYNHLIEQAHAQAIYMNLADFITGGKFVFWKFKLEYKLLTKKFHYNIAPTRFKKELTLANVEFLYIMMNSVVIDVAECTLNEMIAFKEKTQLEPICHLWPWFHHCVQLLRHRFQVITWSYHRQGLLYWRQSKRAQLYPVLHLNPLHNIATTFEEPLNPK